MRAPCGSPTSAKRTQEYEIRTSYRSTHGALGPRTQQAIEAYQRAYNLPLTGELDEMTLARARRGNVDACETIFRKFQHPAFSVAFRICQCREAAQEVTQEAFITAFRKIRQFRGDSPFWGWLRRVVVNHAISQLRKAQYMTREAIT